jgi:phosphoserine aminotransferase
LIYLRSSKKYGSSWNYFSYRKEEILGKSGRISILDYENISKQKYVQYTSCFLFMLHYYLQWLKNLGGVAAIEKLNNAKAALYGEIDKTII